MSDRVFDPADLSGVRIERRDAHQHLRGAVQHAVEATLLVARTVPGAPNGAMKLAAVAALQTVNALMSAVGARCTLAAPPEDIEMSPDSAGHLIYQCFHNPAHKWDLNGSQLP
jgi:hypothetical protein